MTFAANSTVQKQTLRTILGNRSLLHGGDKFVAEEYYEQAGLLYYTLFRALAAGRELPELIVQGEEVSLYRYYLNTLVASIPEGAKKDKAQEFADAFDDSLRTEDNAQTFALLVATFAQMTPAFLTQFHAYHSAFSNVDSHKDHGEYCAVAVGGILQKQYAQRIKIAA